MAWLVRFHDEFELEFLALTAAVQDELLAHAKLLAAEGPALGRPHVDTLAGSKHANMKEMRFMAANGVWRVAFAFDPERAAILLVAGDKAGVSQKRFYRGLVERADRRFDDHLQSLKAKRKDRKHGPIT
ncbi:type II toxin-antitoxin system RelE/ParE family toxin [Indioceanicola profundi]|uniref:type II toxin-antitoxin system RelE/ParE family toxin n=1 Tax=Indioceanicola profundi TaxID=2220096 RepID=UPI000E6AC18B|nr:type II toxin-antitoxin system RelE/ParE family toxin [Indioceanicola profundi]